MSTLSMKDKVAVVSGSASGIGFAIAQELSSRGATVVINYHFSNLKDVASSAASRLTTPSIAIEADLSTIDGPQKLIDQAIARFGHIDILVNNAGLATNKALNETTLADWDRMVNLNGRGTFLLTQAALPHFPPRGGRIVNVVSISARAAPPLQSIYSGTKGMCDSFTRVWAKELPRRYGVTVNAVSPGPTMTEGFAQAGPEFMAEVQPIIEQTPVESRMGRPDEIAYAVAFLCEPRASWINGTHIMACGGLYVD